MERGAFVVSRRQDDPQDILFETRNDRDAASDEQLALKDEIEHALMVLRVLFPTGDARFETYFLPLLSLAQVGLSADPAQPGVARRALASLKNQIVSWEGARIKNRYMKELGIRAIALAAVPAIAAIALHSYGVALIPKQFALLWVGCMAGVWLSFGARKANWTFDDLHIPEQDRLEPVVRLVFAGLLTVIIGLSFSTGTVAVTVGSVSTSNINNTARVALLLGMLCGFSEQILSSRVARQASSFLDAGK